MLRVVVDTNVLISALISQRNSAPDQIVRALYEGEFDLVLSPQLVGELMSVLSRKKLVDYVDAERVDAYIEALVSDAILIEDVPDPPRVTPDRNDDYLFALALNSNADFIVSGDQHLTGLDSSIPPVLTPREFVKKLSNGI